MPSERATDTAPESSSSPDPEKQQPESPDANTEDVKKPDPVRRLTLIVACVIIVLFVWYVAADRFAPWTDEARVQGYVVPIVAEVSGRVLEVNVDNDQIVKTGEALLRIDPRNYEIAVRRAQAALDTAGQEVGASAAGVKSAAEKITNNRAQLRKAAQDFDRVENMFRQDPGAVSKAQRVRMRETLAQAKAQVSLAEAELERAKEQLGKEGKDDPAFKSAVAALEQAQIDLKRTTVYAPGLGLITNLKIDVGHYAKTGTALMTFVSGTDVWVQANMRENTLGHVKPGNAVDLVLDVAPDAHPGAKGRGGFQPGYSAAAAHNAMKSTLVVLPVATVFIAAHWSSQALVIIFIAIYSVAPVLRVSKQDSFYKFLANVLGGCAALVFYWLLVAVPEYYFLIALSLLSALVFGSVMFSDKPTAPYYSSAFSTLLVLISTSMGEGADFGANFWIRVGLVALAGLYVVGALSVLEHIWPPPEPIA